MRLFFALWPDKAVRERLAAAGEALPRRSGRRVPEQNLHLTLAFLGGVPEATAAALRDGMTGIHAPPFDLRLDHCGWFRSAGVVWLAPSEPPPALTGLVGAIRTLISGCGLVPEARPFHPHLTLARKARRHPGRPGFEPVDWPVRDFCLVESVTRSDGPEYRVLRSQPLS